MAERFNQRVNIQPVSSSTGASQAALSLVDRLEQFKSMAYGVAEQNAIKRGETSASQTTLTKKDGITKQPTLKKEGWFGSVEAQAHNKGLRAAYLASLDSDIKTNVARIEAENANDIIGFNDQIEGFRKGIINSVDPASKKVATIAVDERIASSRAKVQTATIKKQKEAAKQTLLISEKQLSDDAILSARNGQVQQSAVSILDHHTNIDSQVEANFITAFEGEEKKRNVELLSANENIIGQIRRDTDKGNYTAVLKSIETLRSKVSGGRTVKEHEDLISATITEITESLNLRSKIETLEDEQIESTQKSNFATLFNGIISPNASLVTNAGDITRSLTNKTLDDTQATQLVNLLNNRGRGVDKFDLINNINSQISKVKTQADADSIISAIASNTGVDLTEKTASDMLTKLGDAVSGESVLFTNEAKRAKSFAEANVGAKNQFGFMTFEDQTRWAVAEREFDTRVLAGEDPFTVADQLVGKSAYEREAVPLYGTKEDLPGALERTNQALLNKQISEDDYNAEYALITNLMKMKENISAFNNAKKEVDNAKR